MSWSGPVAGTPYQPPPYTHGQLPFQQAQTYQHGQQPNQNQYQPVMYNQPNIPPRPPENRPPKKKGNPIITKYPPPPGYQGPAQSRGSYGMTQHPAPYQQHPPAQQPYPQPPPASNAYPSQGYQAPPTPQGYPPNYGPPVQTHPQPPVYPQPSYQPAPNYQWPQQPQQGYQQQPPQPSSYPNGQGYGPAHGTYQGYPTPITPASQAQQTWPQTPGWPQASVAAPYPSAGPLNPWGAPQVNAQPMPAPHAIPTPTSAYPTASQSTPISAQSLSATSEITPGDQGPLNLALYDWDFDFDGAIWPKASEPVDPNFSLGQIVWHPAEQVTRALPSSAVVGQQQADNPPAEKLGNGESVSIYFTTENSHEAFLDVRQTDDWDKIKDDPIFVVFTDGMMAELIPIENCISLRDRPDEPIEEINQEKEEDEAIHDSSWDVMDDLEQALSGTAEDQKLLEPPQHEGISRDRMQEDILAKLGVTGKPKTPSDEVISLPFSFNAKPPASLPPKPPARSTNSIPPRPVQPPSRAHSYGGHHNPTYGPQVPRPYGSVSSSKSPLPNARRYEPPRFSNPQDRPSGPTFDGARESPTRSEESNHTMAGSDFEPEKTAIKSEQDAGSIPQLKRSDSSFARKRSYEDTDYDDQKTRQPDDYARRKRRSQVAAAYSRR